MKRTWALVAVAIAGALGGLAVSGLPGDVPDDLVITERPVPSTAVTDPERPTEPSAAASTAPTSTAP